MLFGHDFTKSVNKPNPPVKLYTFTGIIEQNLKYILNLVSTLEDPSVKYKNDDKSDRLVKLNADIKSKLAVYPPDKIIKTVTLIAALEGAYNSTNEIKGYIKDVKGMLLHVKYPSVGFDLSEIAIKISGIAKKAVDGFFPAISIPI